MGPIGKVNDLTKEFNFEWKIDNFFSLSGENEEYYSSPLFSFADESWHLNIHPNGDPENDAVGYISVYLHRELSGLPIINLSWSFGLKTFDGKKVHEEHHTGIFNEDGLGYGSPELLKRSTLLERKSELVPSNILTIVITVDYCSISNDVEGTIVTSKCSHCEKALFAESISSHEEKCLEKPIQCLTCSELVTLRKWFVHECQAVRVKAAGKLVVDLENLLNSEENSDITIKVKDQEFRLHRNILASRNPYFSSMFKSEMKEKSTGIVSIDDCDPDIFHSFIYFLYTGKTKELSEENVCALYKVADKYQEDQLKAECLCYMKNRISVDSCCDFIVLALIHDEKELLKTATELFCRKTKEIIRSAKWQIFMKQYTTQANELYIKSFDVNAK